MIISYFGSYDSNYARNRVIIKGLKENKIDIIECNCRKTFILRFFILVKKAITSQFDVIFVAYPGHLDIFAAKIVSLIKKKPIIFDAFISTYDTMINEWQYGTRHSLKGRYYHWLDKTACRFADLVLIDTEQHIDYYVKEFKVDRKKFEAVPVGTDETEVYPCKKTGKSRKFTVLYYGYVQPLHGFNHIVGAARLLKTEKDIEFIFIGDNRWYRNVRDENKDLINVRYENAMPYNEILKYLRDADVSLGIFGTTIKSKNAIPNKVYEALAMKKAVITGDTLAARAYLIDKENAILCKTGSTESIANSIMLLKNNPGLKEKISENGYKLFKNNFTTKKIGNRIKNIIKSRLKTE